MQQVGEGQQRRDAARAAAGAAVARATSVAPALAATLLVLAILIAGPATAEEGDGAALAQTSAESTSTTTSPSSTSTSTTSTTAAPGGAGASTTTTTTTTTAPPLAEPEDDAPPEEVPADEVVVPEREGPAPSDAPPPVLQETAAKAVELQNALLAQTMAAASAAAEEAARLETELATLEARLSTLKADRAAAVASYREVRSRLRDRAVAAYIGSPSAEVNHVLSSRDVNQLVRRTEMLRSVAEADRVRLDDYAEARRRVGRAVESVVSQIEETENAATIARTLAGGYAEGLASAQVRLAGAEIGGGIVSAGFVFPVAGKRWFSDTWGAPRMPGTPFEHRHQGTDIFADTGTPLVACERGVVIRMGTDTLGGTKLWLVGASGTRYYYAHLSAFADGIHDGLAVEAGTVVGYVGNTGNARTTPPHLHFQVHPGGGPPINPYPMLKIVDDAVRDLDAT